MKEQCKVWVKQHLDEGMDLVKAMYEHPELGDQEFESMALLCEKLKQLGFAVERSYLLPTGFIGRYDSGKPGPKIAFLCEYDALPEVGHGCGHNLIAAIGVLAGGAYKAVIDQLGGEVRVIGTPAEENFGGKVRMAEKGCFDDLDAAMMIHPGTENRLGGRTNALMPLKFEFFGKNAHACHPQEGRSALDAAVNTFVAINMLRQFTEPGSFIHGIVKDGGEAANVIPAYASLEYYFRAPTMAVAKAMSQRAVQCAEGACQMAGTTLKTSMYECPYEDNKINYTLCSLLEKQYTELGLSEIQPVDEVPGGSSDIGAVSYRCPALHGYIQICGCEVTGHSREMAAATISPQGRAGLENGASALAMCAVELASDPQLLQQVKEEFTR